LGLREIEGPTAHKERVELVKQSAELECWIVSDPAFSPFDPAMKPSRLMATL
jgi:hypothetical protein